MNDNIIYCSDDVEISPMPPSAYRTETDYIIHESHNMKNPMLPFIFATHIARGSNTSL